MPVVVGVTQFTNNLAILTIALAIAVSLAALANRVRVSILVHEARILAIRVLLDQS